MMNLRSSAFIGGCLLFAAHALAQAPAEMPTTSVRYKCDNKQSLQVDYSTPAGKAPRAVITTSKPPKGAKTTDGKPAKTSWTMSKTASSEGAQYEDSKKTMGWHSRGSEGHLTDLKTHKSIRCTEFASSR
jgi:membrane-bound inhibitor of C-type lysozyme